MLEEDEIIKNINSDKKDEKTINNNLLIKKPNDFMSANQKDNNNWMVYNYFLRYDFEKCREVLNKVNTVKKNDVESEFSVFTKGLIKRYNGEIEKAIELLKKSYAFNSNEIFTLKEIGKSLVLTGKYSLSIDIYDEVLASFPDDWETYHYKGIASMNDKSYEMAQACFEKALALNHNEAT